MKAKLNQITQKIKIPAIAGILAICLAGGSQSAKAQLYDVQFSDPANYTAMSGAAVWGSAGDVWNNYLVNWSYDNNPNPMTLADTTGNSSAGVTVGVWNYGGPSYWASGNTTVANPAALMDDYIYSAPAGDGWPIRAELGGLADDASYQLVVYASGNASGQGATISLATDSTFSTILQSVVTTGNDRDITQGQGDAYQIFSGTTSATGTIDFEVANTSQYHALNGLQLDVESVPEPGTYALVLSGAGALLGFRARRKA